jgi:hypothetical protein
MADRYIDYEETQIYGPQAAQQMRKRVLKLVPKFDAALGYVADELDDATAAVGSLLGSTRGHDADRRTSRQAKASLLEEALDVLGRFSKHLDAHKDGIDRKRFFPDGTKTAIGRSAPRVLLALTHIADLLGKKDSPVREAKEWHKEISAAAAALAPAVAHSDSARAARRDATPALMQAREAWLQVYAAAKGTVEAVLRLTGKLNLLPIVFPDLAVSDGGGAAPEPPAPAPAGDDPAPAPALAPPAKKKPAARTRKR